MSDAHARSSPVLPRAALRRVLLPLDGSELAEGIVPIVRRVLDARDLEEVRLVQVARDDGGAPAAEAYLGGVADGLRGLPTTRAVLIDHDPAAALVGFLEDWAPDLVAMSTHGRSGLRRLVRGSVAERVLRSSPAPLLLANTHAIAGRGPPPLERIVVALDGSQLAREVLPLVERIAALHGAEVVLLRVETELSAPDDEELHPRVRRGIEGLLEPQRARFEESGIAARLAVVPGLPSEQIPEAAAAEGAGLLAMTTHGTSGLPRWWLGSVAEAVARECPCPLLLVRSGAP